MLVVLAVDGSTGDVQPTLAFCAYLASSGHEAVLCSSASKIELDVNGKPGIVLKPPPDLPPGCSFVRLSSWEQSVVDDFFSAMATDDNEAQFKILMADGLGNSCLASCEAVVQTVRERKPDVFLSNNAALAAVVHEACGTPCGKLALQPQIATDAFPAFTDSAWIMGMQRAAADRPVSMHSRVPASQEFKHSYTHFAESIDSTLRALLEKSRSRVLGPTIAPLPAEWPIWTWGDSPSFTAPSTSAAPAFVLNTFSPCFLSEGFAYAPSTPIVGPWMFSEEECKNATVPAALAAFLESCTEPPVYVGFGSMNFNGPLQWTRLVLSALYKFGPTGRHLVGAGWVGLSLDVLTDEDEDLRQWAAEHVFFIDAHVQHSWLFPRCRLAVHHGGAGTLHAVSRAGLPQVVVPLIVDQPMWGVAVEEVGAGVCAPKLLKDPSLTGDELCACMQRVDTEEVKAAAQQLQRAMEAHGDGRANALKVLQQMVSGVPMVQN